MFKGSSRSLGRSKYTFSSTGAHYTHHTILTCHSSAMAACGISSYNWRVNTATLLMSRIRKNRCCTHNNSHTHTFNHSCRHEWYRMPLTHSDFQLETLLCQGLYRPYNTANTALMSVHNIFDAKYILHTLVGGGGGINARVPQMQSTRQKMPISII